MKNSKKYLVVNAIPKEIDSRLIKLTDRLAFTTPLSQINRKIKELTSDRNFSHFGHLRNIPIIVYCKNEDCDASEKLIEKLRH